MDQPLPINGARVCVLEHPDEIVVCANSQGFKSLGAWIAWLADSKPEELYHFHLLGFLESEASKFEGARPSNVWFLRTPSSHQVSSSPPDGWNAVPFEVTFQVLTDSALDELATAQDSGIIPDKYLKSEASYVGRCG
jgi:hypothetical protein